MLLKAVLGFNGFILPQQLSHILSPLSSAGVHFEVTQLMNKFRALGFILIGFILVLGFKNTSEKMDTFKPTLINAIFVVTLFIYSVLNLTKASVFLYFKF